MNTYYPSDLLKTLRNQIPIEKLILTTLNLHRRQNPNWLRFRCPLCHNYHTATNPNTNLARCFDCKKNFNPIDLVMAVCECSFVQAVEYLKQKLP